MRLVRSFWLLALLCASVLLPSPFANAKGFQVPPVYPTGFDAAPMITADLNGDGKLDLATQGYYGVSVLLGNGDGTFGAAVLYPTDPASTLNVGDMNGDGIADLITTGQSMNVLFGNGDGTFQAPIVTSITGLEGSAAALGDCDGDGIPDAVATDVNGAVFVLLGHVDGTFTKKAQYRVGQFPQSMVLANLNGDDKLDLALVDYPANTVNTLLGNGDGTFQPAVSAPLGFVALVIAAADFNGDGNLDLAASGYLFPGNANGVAILFGEGDGTFQPAVEYPEVGQSANMVTVADYNGDGKPDLGVVFSFGTGAMLNQGDGTFGVPVTYAAGNGSHIVAGDFNRDGKLDMAVDDEGHAVISILRGRGDGTFATAPLVLPVSGYPKQYVVADLNRDGKQDLVFPGCCSGSSWSVSISLGNGDGSFQRQANFAAGTNKYSVAVADFDSDGKLDVAAAGPVDGLFVLRGNGDGTLLPSVTIDSNPSVYVAVGDLNGDGKLDLLSGAHTLLLLLGKGDGTFEPAISIDPIFSAMKIVIADFNRDGKPDLGFGNGLESAILLGNGDGTFQSRIALPAAATDLVAGDLNGDSILDLVVDAEASPYLGVYIQLGNGDGTFQPPILLDSSLEASLQLADFDGDGKLDLTIGQQYDGITLLFGNGDGTFQAPVTYLQMHSPTAVGYFNADSALDLLAAYSGSAATAMLNSGGTSENLISSPNPSKVGQAVTFTATVRASLQGTGAPTGTVTFMAGTHELGTASLISGKARFTTSGLRAGTHEIVALYSGDANFNPNQSLPLTQKVTKH